MEAIACNNLSHDYYPFYGVAPHNCYYKLGKNIGESEIKARSEWPSNFTPDQDQSNEESENYGSCGVYTCPGSCNKGEE